MNVSLKRRALAALLALSACVLSACAPRGGEPPAETAAAQTAAVSAKDPSEKTTVTGFYFDTVVTITLYGAPDGMAEELLAECARYEALLSKTAEGSDVSRIHAANGEPVAVDPETWTILRDAKRISDLTGHAFSVTIAPLSAMWDFTGGTERMPSDGERIAALPLVNDDALVLGDGGTVTLPAGMSVDLGGIAKGYIADRLAERCREAGVPALLNFGGNVYAEGTKPNGSAWRVGINDPQHPNNGSPIAVADVYDRTVVTSGTYERYFDKDGKRFHHILDPQTGLPADTDLTSCTIIGSSSMDADALATACIVLGLEKAKALLEANGIDAVLIDTENRITLTNGFRDHYPLTVSGS